MEKEIRRHGFYRTQRLVLAAWDRMEADGTFIQLGLGDASVTHAVPALVDLPPIESLRSDAWSWPTSIQPRDRLRYAAQYALWLNPVNDADRTRFLIASLAEPALLTALLTGSDQSEWIRLVGSDAKSAQGVVRLRPAINEAWRVMFEKLLTSGQLAEAADGGLKQGQHFDPTGLRAQSVDAQRSEGSQRWLGLSEQFRAFR
jgi:hypothetical protein